jgi:putative thiamine transport system permease protein
MVQRRDRVMMWVAVGLLALIFAPLLPGLFWAMLPAFNLPIWQALVADPQWLQALIVTVISACVGSLLALLLALLVAIRFYTDSRWQKIQQRLPLLLAMPHAAFAVGVYFLIAPSGWLSRIVSLFFGWVTPPNLISVRDDFGLSLALALAFKESWFLLWVLFSVLGEQLVSRQMTIARTLGYNRWQVWQFILLPQLLPRIGWPLVAVLAYGLSVVDMALILGPTNPPTLAVLTWKWLMEPDPQLQAQGSAAALVLLVVLLLLVVMARLIWHGLHLLQRYPVGKRGSLKRSAATYFCSVSFIIGYAVLFLLLLWSFADSWFFPSIWPDRLTSNGWWRADFLPFKTSLWLGLAVTLFCLPITLFWLEWGPKKWNALLYLPLIIPALPLMAGQYSALLHLHFDGTALGLIWSHLLWVLPYVLLTLVGPYRAFDLRMMTTAQAFGMSRFMACWRVKWPVLMKPIMAAMAIGFAVSIAQYLPTLFAGGGRFDTVTTEAVALSAGGNRRTLAIQAVLQIALPLMVFIFSSGIPMWLAQHRKGLR